MTSDLATLQTIINHAHRLVFFGGAGVSTESGIPDFRSQDGLYHQKYDSQPLVFCPAHRGILSLLSGQDDLPIRKAQRCPQKARRTGAERHSVRRCHTKH